MIFAPGINQATVAKGLTAQPGERPTLHGRQYVTTGFDARRGSKTSQCAAPVQHSKARHHNQVRRPDSEQIKPRRKRRSSEMLKAGPASDRRINAYT